ncbi:hypothetical protein GCM10017772_42950 [Promicromonospora soli]|uniref:Uncharacterized protein n=1 Tax=Promicromonospora soli TaxID=2035533 RepID=A0A919G7N1_9MICO|nr:hypothetical protein GCM10017772_42950 [Promicromonospora soli]
MMRTLTINVNIGASVPVCPSMVKQSRKAAPGRGGRPWRPGRRRGSEPGAAPAAPLTPEGPEPGSGEQVRLRSLLTCGAEPAGVSLWRRTDFRGFPVVGYG